ncbi:uncharacterized protein LOC117071275 [Trachypithecus francoisi]|uniref:uncharacterized protein LOC117071275 n=1 Tax=Trachypithecus francoisi TaxID=54180 RepID=UPI00141B59E1|nr:uncharacterized protein LOC117071275 [Trachypithecus francoisi]
MSPVLHPLPAQNSTQNQLAQRHQRLHFPASPAARCDHKTTLGPGRREDGAGELSGNSGKSPHRGRVVPCSPLLLPHSWNTDVKAGAQVATWDHELQSKDPTTTPATITRGAAPQAHTVWSHLAWETAAPHMQGCEVAPCVCSLDLTTAVSGPQGAVLVRDSAVGCFGDFLSETCSPVGEGFSGYESLCWGQSRESQLPDGLLRDNTPGAARPGAAPTGPGGLVGRSRAGPHPQAPACPTPQPGFSTWQGQGSWYTAANPPAHAHSSCHPRGPTFLSQNPVKDPKRGFC